MTLHRTITRRQKRQRAREAAAAERRRRDAMTPEQRDAEAKLLELRRRFAMINNAVYELHADAAADVVLRGGKVWTI